MEWADPVTGSSFTPALGAKKRETKSTVSPGAAVWNDNPPEQWKSALAAVISKTRSLISATGLDGSTVLISTGGTYGFSPSPRMWIDLEQAYRRLDHAEGSLRHDDPMSAAQEATVASATLRRPFLPGESGLWLEEARSRQSDALYRCYVTLAAAWKMIGAATGDQ